MSTNCRICHNGFSKCRCLSCEDMISDEYDVCLTCFKKYGLNIFKEKQKELESGLENTIEVLGKLKKENDEKR